MSKILAGRLKAARNAVHPPLLLADDARCPTVRIEPPRKVIGCVVEVTVRKRII